MAEKIGEVTIGVEAGLTERLRSVEQRLSGIQTASDSLADASKRFERSWTELASAVQVAGRAYDIASTAIRGTAELVGEQQRLDAATRSTGLSFDAATASSARYVSQVDAMRAAQSFAAAQFRLTQTELNTVAQGAASLAQMLGTSTQQQVDRIRSAIIGGELEVLRDLGPTMAALSGDSHTAEERMRAFTASVAEMPPAIETADSALARLEGTVRAAGRTAATAAVEEFAALLTAQQHLTDGAGAASASMEDTTTTLRAMGQAAGETALTVLRAAQAIAGGIAAVAIAPATLYRTVFGALAQARSGDFSGAVDTLSNFGSTGALADVTAFADQGVQGFVDLVSGDASARAVRATGPTAAAGRAARGATDGSTGLYMFGSGGALAAPAEAGGRGGRDRGRSGPRARTLDDLMGDALSQMGDARDGLSPITVLGEADRIASEEGKRLAQQRMDERALELSQQQDFTRLMVEAYREQANGARMAAESVQAAFGSMGTAYATHLEALVTGREALGEALQGVLSDTLSAIGKEAGVKAGMQLAEGLATLFFNPAQSATHFAAAAVYTGVAATAGAAGAAVAPSSAGGAAGGAARGAGAAEGLPGGRSTAPREERVPTTINYYAPVIGGRESTDAETGSRLQRYDRAAGARLQRPRAA